MDNLKQGDAGRSHHQDRQHRQEKMDEISHMAVDVPLQRRPFLACFLNGFALDRHAPRISSGWMPAQPNVSSSFVVGMPQATVVSVQ